MSLYYIVNEEVPFFYDLITADSRATFEVKNVGAPGRGAGPTILQDPLGQAGSCASLLIGASGRVSPIWLLLPALFFFALRSRRA